MKTMKPFSGKAIYHPSGRAGEYSYWACNFYLGCSCNCAYCYNKTGRFKATMGGDTPTLKKSFKNETHALEIFEKELRANLPELQKHGLFFTFTSDFALSECYDLTMKAVDICVENEIPVKLLTKRADWVDNFIKTLSE
jgi:DNA repair photolyase